MAHQISTTPRKRQHSRPGAAHQSRVGIHHLPQRIGAGLLFGNLLCMAPGLAHGAGTASAQALLQPIALNQAQPLAVGTGVGALGQQPRPDWITGLVEFFSAVPPECRSVSQENTQQKCQERERGVLERFKESHPVAFNLLVAAVTLLAGFYIGGGFKGGR